MTVRIRTTMQPDRELEVTDSEASDLARQGLLEDDQPGTRQDTPASPSGTKPTLTK